MSEKLDPPLISQRITYNLLEIRFAICVFEIIEDIVGAERSVLFFEIVNPKFFVFGGRHFYNLINYFCCYKLAYLDDEIVDEDEQRNSKFLLSLLLD